MKEELLQALGAQGDSSAEIRDSSGGRSELRDSRIEETGDARAERRESRFEETGDASAERRDSSGVRSEIRDSRIEETGDARAENRDSRIEETGDARFERRESRIEETGDARFERRESRIEETGDARAENRESRIECRDSRAEIPEERAREPSAEQRLRQAREHLDSLYAQAADLRREFPDFDLEAALGDADFVRLTAPGLGVDLRRAYYALNRPRLDERAARRGAEESGRLLTKALASGGSRPREGGGQQAAGLIAADYRHLSRSQQQDLKQRILEAAARGEKLYP